MIIPPKKNLCLNINKKNIITDDIVFQNCQSFRVIFKKVKPIPVLYESNVGTEDPLDQFHCSSSSYVHLLRVIPHKIIFKSEYQAFVYFIILIDFSS